MKYDFEREVICLLVEKLKNNWLLIALGCVIVVFLFINRDAAGTYSDNAEIIAAKDTEDLDPDLTVTEEIVIVDIKGEVKQPGVYEIDSQARVNDAIVLAGGFTSEANEFVVNLAQKVHDEMTIIVPTLEEEGIQLNNDTSSTQVNVNRATQEDLETLHGIGPSKAEAIINYRDEHGYFQSIEDLLNVSGIGEKTLDNIRDDIQIP